MLYEVITKGQPESNSDCYVEYKSVHQKNGEVLYLFLIKENSKLPSKTIDKISEVVQVAINLWGDKHNEVSEYALSYNFV